MTPSPAPLSIDADGFLRNGRPHRTVSAAIHYFRVRPELWEDRLLRLRAMGVNTVETYVAWNFHEPRPGEHLFDGDRDVVRFIRTAGELGLDVIVRPGPYICAEWDLGGLPAWLLSDRNIRLRRRDPRYLAAVDAWFDVLLPRLLPLLATRGGPVVAMSVENEYGSFGNDTAHLEYLRDAMVARGVDCLLFTADGGGENYLLGGRIPGVLAAATFGGRPEESLAVLRAHQPQGPLFVVEYWHGWFDQWGEPHRTRDAAEAADTLDRLLGAGASVNIYMGHGGTNFGWWNGALDLDRHYRPDTTSYDYGAPVGEAGELTEKFHRFREVIARHLGPVAHPLPPLPPRLTPRRAEVTERVALRSCLDVLGKPQLSDEPLTMEEAGQSFGLIHYRTHLRGPVPEVRLSVDGLADRAQVFLDGHELGVLDRNHPDDTLTLSLPAGGATLELLVENQGRINYGPRLTDRKGVTEDVRLDNQYQFGWENRPLPLDDLTELPFAPVAEGPTPESPTPEGPTSEGPTSEGPTPQRPTSEGPTFHRAFVTVDEPADGFVALPGWTKGMVWLNGFALGRYWETAGPQRTLYAPAPLWRAGENELVVLELHRPGSVVEIRDTPDLGPAAPAPIPA